MEQSHTTRGRRADGIDRVLLRIRRAMLRRRRSGSRRERIAREDLRIYRRISVFDERRDDGIGDMQPLARRLDRHPSAERFHKLIQGALLLRTGEYPVSLGDRLELA